MRTLCHILFWIFFCSVIPCLSQTNTFANHVYDDEVRSLISKNGLSFYVEQVYTSGYIDSTNIICVKANNTVKFKRRISILASGSNILETSNIKKIDFSLDDKVVFCGVATACDYIDPNTKLFIAQLDTNGNFSFLTTIPSPTNFGFNGGFDSFCQLTDSSYAVFSDNLIHKFSKTGTYTGSVSTTYASTSICHRNLAGEIIFNSANNLIKLNTSFNQIGSITIGISPTHIMQGANGDYYLSNANSFVKTNQALSSFTSSAFSGGTLSDIKLYNDTLYACGKNNANLATTFRFDNSFTLLNQSSSSYPNLIYKGIFSDVTHTRLIGLEHCDHPVFPNKNSFYYKLNKTASLFLRNDAAVTGLTKDTAYANFVPALNPMTPGTLTFYFKMKVKIANYGLDTLKAININFINTQFQNFCGRNYYLEEFNNLLVPPQGTVEALTNWITDSYNSWTSYIPGNLALGNVCFWTSIPNNNSDANHLNDRFCANFNAIVLGNKSALSASENNEIVISPNPVFDKFQIQFKTQTLTIQRLSLFEMDGKPIHLLVDSNEVNISHLAKGMYVLVIETNKGNVYKKIIKD